jgi:hypothetical protein
VKSLGAEIAPGRQTRGFDECNRSEVFPLVALVWARCAGTARTGTEDGLPGDDAGGAGAAGLSPADPAAAFAAPRFTVSLLRPAHFVLVETASQLGVRVWDPDGEGPGKAAEKQFTVGEWGRQWTGIVLEAISSLHHGDTESRRGTSEPG